MTSTGRRPGSDATASAAPAQPGRLPPEPPPEPDRRWAFRTLIAGFAVSSAGSYLNMVALNVFVYQVTHSAVFVGLFIALRLASGFAGGLLAGGLVAGLGPKRAMLIANAAQGAVLAGLVVTPPALRPAALVVVAVVTGCGGALFIVALRSGIPDLVGGSALGEANSATVAARSIAMVAGFASAGLVVARLGYTAAFLIDAATFAVCLVMVLPLPALPAAVPTGAGGEKLSRLTAGQKAALRRLRAVPGLTIVVAIRIADAAGSSSHNTALPVYSASLNPAEPAQFVGEFWACWAIGNLLAQLVVRRYLKRTGRPIGDMAFAVGTVLMSAGFILAFAGFPAPVTGVLAGAAGAADGVTEVAYTTRLQEVPAEARSYAFGLSATAESTAFGLGALITAGLIGHLSILTIIGGAHGSAIVIAGSFLLWMARRRRRSS